MKVPPGLEQAPKLYTKKDIATAAGRSLSSVGADMRDPECPLRGNMRRVPGGRAHVTTPDVVQRYLDWIWAKTKAAS